MITTILTRLLGFTTADEIEQIRFSFAAAWVRNGPAWLVFAGCAVVALAVVFYLRFQPAKSNVRRVALASARTAVLLLLVFTLAEPVAVIHLRSKLRPVVWFLVDDTESMTIRDAHPKAEEAATRQVTAFETTGGEQAPPRRIDYVRSLLRNRSDLFRERLAKEFQLQWYRLANAEGVDLLPAAESAQSRTEAAPVLPDVEALTAKGEVTALGAALADLARRRAGVNLGAVVILSDFNQNAGPPPLQAAETLGVPLFTVGLGRAMTSDVAVELQLPPLLKKDERALLTAVVRHEGYDGQTVRVAFAARRVSSDPSAPAAETPLGERTVVLDQPSVDVTLPIEPHEAGHFEFVAQVDPLPEETVVENNRSVRDNYVREYYLRLLFAEYEPTWEWRFVKEVFHRDRLVGEEGFRTYLRSADLSVRRRNPLFLETLSLPRSEFFSYDVIILGDMPDAALTSSFCEMTREFVGEMGGGLVVLAGPRFGAGRLMNTPLGDMLPVQLGAHSQIRQGRPFRLRRTAEADLYDFMQLGDNPLENDQAWLNLGPLAWYQPVERLRPMATALAVHPTDKCIDGVTPQPIIAVTNYGKGEVVYIGFNELWRLRRKYGNLYYRRFWGQLIHRLALRHALGTQKRFVARTDRKEYKAGDTAVLTVEAYDADYHPLGDDLTGGVLEGRLVSDRSVQALRLTMVRPGLFQTRSSPAAGGEYRFQVRDPITGDWAESRFQVQSRSVEKQVASRNLELQRRLAETTGGRAYELREFEQLIDDLPAGSKTETTVQEVPLWNTWPVFLAVVGVLFGEWFFRKRANLA